MRKPQPRQAKGAPCECKGCGQRGKGTTRCQAEACGWTYCDRCAGKQITCCGHCGRVTCIVCTVVYLCGDRYCLRRDDEDDGDRTVCQSCVVDNMCRREGCNAIAYPCCAQECVDCGLSFCDDHITGRDDFDYVFLCDGCCDERLKEREGETDEDEDGEGTADDRDG